VHRLDLHLVDLAAITTDYAKRIRIRHVWRGIHFGIRLSIWLHVWGQILFHAHIWRQVRARIAFGPKVGRALVKREVWHVWSCRRRGILTTRKHKGGEQKNQQNLHYAASSGFADSAS